MICKFMKFVLFLIMFQTNDRFGVDTNEATEYRHCNPQNQTCADFNRINIYRRRGSSRFMEYRNNIYRQHHRRQVDSRKNYYLDGRNIRGSNFYRGYGYFRIGRK